MEDKPFDIWAVACVLAKTKKCSESWNELIQLYKEQIETEEKNKTINK